MGRARLLVRWSWRDLRQRWVLVATIALILGLGTGVYAALGSTAQWREESNDVSFAATKVHDLRVVLSSGTVTAQGRLASLVGRLADPTVVEAAVERLQWPTQVELGDPTAPGGTVLLKARLVGAPAQGGVDEVWLREGTAEQAVLELRFAARRGLAAQGALTLSGGTVLPWSGIGMQPEHFMGGDDSGTGLAMLDPGGFLTAFAPLDVVQRVAGEPGQVNDLVLRLRPGADRSAVKAGLERALATLPDVSATVTTTDDIRSYRVLYDDIGNDQQVWDLISWLILLGAAFAAFNLVTRVVEAQRREIGIGMALGVARRELAVRPLLVGVQVALLGVALGVAVGLGVDHAIRGMYESVLPLPMWRTPFGWSSFARAVVVGLTLPVLATAIPVWRAVRMQPVEAIRTGRFATASAGLAGLGRRLRWPRRATAQYPVRNLLRNARRSILTALAIASAVVVLVGIVGMLDSFTRTVDRASAALSSPAPDRFDVTLDSFQPAAAAVGEVGALPGVAEAVATLSLPARLRAVGAPAASGFDVGLTVLPFGSAPWTPRPERGGAPSAATGVLISAKAADDLGVGPGDEVVLVHPVRQGTGYRLQASPVRVAGIHGVPVRAPVFLDTPQLDLLGLQGVANGLQVLPAPGADRLALQRALFAMPGVASASPVADLSSTFRDALGAYTGILRVMEGAVLVLALLIAFNSVSIGVDERAREHATMFAFGLSVRSVVAMTVAEALVLGLVGTVLGVAGGWLVLQWMFSTLLPRTMPELLISVHLAPTTVAAALVAGVLAVAVAPLLTIGKLRRMDVPATLRVVE